MRSNANYTWNYGIIYSVHAFGHFNYIIEKFNQNPLSIFNAKEQLTYIYVNNILFQRRTQSVGREFDSTGGVLQRISRYRLR